MSRWRPLGMLFHSVILAGLLATQFALAAENRGDLPEPVLRAHGDLVLINATVVDGQDHLVTSLRPDQFRLLEEKQERQLASVTLEETPISVVVVLDVSGSMKHDIGQSLAALNALLEGLRPDDDVALVTFSDRPTLAVPFTNDLEQIQATARTAKVGGGTALLDAVAMGFHEAKAKRDGRRHAVVVLTDGGDRDSRLNWRDLHELAVEADARVYPFLLWSAADEFGVEQAELHEIADETGGRIFPVSRSRQLPEEVSKLELHEQYVLGFVPAANARDGRYRHVKVELRNSPGHLKLYWKHGYLSPAE